MQTSLLLAKVVLNQAAVLMNDPNRTVYTHTVAIPYLNLALQELEEEFELNNIQVTETTSSDPITLAAGLTEIRFAWPGPKLPADMIEPLRLWERASGIDPYIPMTKKDFIPQQLTGSPISNFVYWVWQSNKIKLLPATQNNDIKIDYIRRLFFPVTDGNSPINVINAQTYLEYRTAGLMAEFVEHNEPRAQSCNNGAVAAIDRSMGISIKGKQTIMTRRRPFRSGYKQRRFM